MKPGFRLAVLATFVAVLVACSDSTGPEKTEGTAAAVSISPWDYTLFGDEPIRLLAEVTDVDGEVITGARLTWQSQDTNVVRVDSLGVVRGVSFGSAVVTVTAAN